ncbi:uncharacterized protein LOC106637674 [Copidosoma floridanum]|uniref:uncharacterized protein LOC106637674 n=1 Tax=Copidosoma floridanum TaxID=29053 RepID=UPI0006C94A5A|nr:uncharacterized protein LOC106637674 [Copidosoma floridanum]
MKLVPSDRLHRSAYSLPHHAVTKPDNPRKNDSLLPGSKLHADVLMVLTRQIFVCLEDCDWRRILWRYSDDQPIMDYRCLTVTYGAVAAPFLASRVMQQLATDGAASYPLAAEIDIWLLDLGWDSTLPTELSQR